MPNKKLTIADKLLLGRPLNKNEKQRLVKAQSKTTEVDCSTCPFFHIRQYSKDDVDGECDPPDGECPWR